MLGSASPRRKELLELVGVPFVVRTADVDEALRGNEAPDVYLGRVAEAKLDGVRQARLTGVAGVLVADTIVVARGDTVLGKPRDSVDAVTMLARLSGATHEVKTRVLLAGSRVGSPALHAETVTTRVTFRAISAEEAERYVATGEGRDKAGSYAVQGRAGAFVSRIEGSYTAVVGLPLSEVVLAMQSLGWV